MGAGWNNMDMKRFWQENEECMPMFTTDKPRVPVALLGLGGIFFCHRLGIPMDRYYAEYETQQRIRLLISEETEEELGLRFQPAIDWGVVMDGSIFGGRVIYSEEASPFLEPVIREPRDVYWLAEQMEDAARPGDSHLLERGLLPKYFEWRDRLKTDHGITVHERLLERKGPGTIAGQLCGVSNFLMWLYTHPREMRELLSLIERILIQYIGELRARMAESPGGLGQADDVAGLMSPDMFEEFILPIQRRVFELYAPDDEDFRTYHADSNMSGRHLELLNELDVTWVNMGPNVDPALIRQKIPQAAICGEIPPNILLHDTPEDVIAAARRDIEAVGGDGGFILSTAGAIPAGTPYENIRAMCYAATVYGRYG